MKFIDEVTLEVKAGDGGAGCVSFYRGAGVPKGGPDGGDGGNGGSVVLKADESVSTLLDLRFARHITADNGKPGTSKDMNGRGAEAEVVRVPVGTLVWNVETGALLADLSETGQEAKIAQGGRGGLGNMNFATSTRRAPSFAQPGTAGETLSIRLELRLLADVGLVGFPNVGKSTLISRISAARPKIADYPFTTLVPNLGVVRVDTGRSFVVADIPGLIPGASDGAGLGFQFLRHISRVRVIVHLLAFDFAEKRDPTADYKAIRRELETFDKDLGEKPEVIVLNKIELPESQALLTKVKRMAKGRDVFAISAVTGEGVKELVQHLSRVLMGDSVGREAKPRRRARA
jgi:GTP-binding protein